MITGISNITYEVLWDPKIPKNLFNTVWKIFWERKVIKLLTLLKKKNFIPAYLCEKLIGRLLAISYIKQMPTVCLIV